MGAERLVVGVDAGGTWVRAVVAGLDGRVRGRASRPGASPVAVDSGRVTRALAETIVDALGDCDRSAVEYVVAGATGDDVLRKPGPARELEGLLRDAGLDCPHEVVGDAVVAFAAGTPLAGGFLLISGTGSVAVRIEERRIVETGGGLGWLLGDEGSGFWLGKEAVRIAVGAMRGQVPAPRLTGLVRSALLDPDQLPDAGPRGAEQLLTALYTGPVARLSTLAPLVVEAAAAGDRAASELLDRGAAHLKTFLDGLRTRGDEAPVVLAGACLAADVLGDRLRRLFTGPEPVRLLRAGDHAAGAAWLAAARLIGDRDPRCAALHRSLTA